MNPLKPFKKQQEDAVSEETVVEEDEVNVATKVKIIAAMLVVAVATYVALWVQEPTDLKTDVLQGTGESGSQAEVLEESKLLAASDTDEEYPTLAEVSIVDFTFTPANMSVAPGTTVVWTNMDDVDHTVTSDSFSSSALEPGDSFNYTFEDEGEYSYECSFHPQMTGKITVEALMGEGTDSLEDADLDEPDMVEDDTNDDFMPDMAASETDLGTDLLTVEEAPLRLNDVEDNDLPEAQIVTLSAEDLMNEQDDLHDAATVSVGESDKLAKSGPEDTLYFLVFAAVLYFGRKKILSTNS